MKTFALLLAAGSSTRFAHNTKKQFFKIKGKEVLYYSLNAFNSSKLIDEIIVVSSLEDIEEIQHLVKVYNFTKVRTVVVGGKVRQESVKNGLEAIKDDGYVLIHDSARPLVDEKIISSLLTALKDGDAATPAIKVVDTIVKVKNGELLSFENRDELYRIQTPQAFKINVIKEAHQKFEGKEATDDTQLIKLLGKKVCIIPGEEKLRKITTLEDTNAIEAYIEQNEHLQN